VTHFNYLSPRILYVHSKTFVCPVVQTDVQKGTLN